MKRYKNTSDFLKDDHFLEMASKRWNNMDEFWRNYLLQNPDQEELVNTVKRQLELIRDSSISIMTSEHQVKIEELWQAIRERGIIHPENSIKRKQYPWLKIAASFILLVGLSYSVYQYVFNKENAERIGSGITLQLQDGSIQVVEETASKTITTSEGQRVVSQEKNVLNYRDSNTQTKELLYNQLTVPFGKKFELILSDGSHVILNSGSKIRYPVKFLPGHPRNVFLDGEAFFEVEKDKTRPFTVVTREMNTEVYGTRFNVTSYKNENNTYTVLVDGSVGVYNKDGINPEHPFVLIPGQRAVYENGSIDIQRVNVEKYTAWTKGELYFMDDRFDLVLKKLERHYNVSIENRYKALNKKRLTSTFKNDSLERVFQVFQKLTPLNYKRKGNKIIITAPDIPDSK